MKGGVNTASSNTLAKLHTPEASEIATMASNHTMSRCRHLEQ